MYFLCASYHSKFPEVTKIKSLRRSAVVEELMMQFRIHRIQKEVVSENGPQFIH